MVVIVSTHPLRLLAILPGGSVAAIGLAPAERHLEGITSLVLTAVALGTASLTLAYVLAVVVEGSIDRRHRTALAMRLGRSAVDAVDGSRCRHC